MRIPSQSKQKLELEESKVHEAENIVEPATENSYKLEDHSVAQTDQMVEAHETDEFLNLKDKTRV